MALVLMHFAPGCYLGPSGHGKRMGEVRRGAPAVTITNV